MLIEEARFTSAKDLSADDLVVEDGFHAAAALAPLVEEHPDTVFTETKRLRIDGWPPGTRRIFLEALAVTGVVREARAGGPAAQDELPSGRPRPRREQEQWSTRPSPRPRPPPGRPT